MNRETIQTPLGRRFAAALDATRSGRSRLGIEAYTAAFLVAEPALATSHARRARLSAAIEELVGEGVIRASRAQDRSELPVLPRFIVVIDGMSDPPIADTSRYPWRPELVWAARLPLRQSEFQALRAVQGFLRDVTAETPVVPMGERSLELFDDEKRLDSLARNRRLFAPGRLSLGLLRARAFAPPFAYRHVGPGHIALVLENVATYRSVLGALSAASDVGLVIFGSGGNFAASVGYLAELAHEGVAATIREIRYFGDLDRRGLETPIAADITAREMGLPAVLPAVRLWALLLRVGKRARHVPVDTTTAERLAGWLPASMRGDAIELLTSGMRVAQEAVGTMMLGDDPIWDSRLSDE